MLALVYVLVCKATPTCTEGRSADQHQAPRNSYADRNHVLIYAFNYFLIISKNLSSLNESSSTLNRNANNHLWFVSSLVLSTINRLQTPRICRHTQGINHANPFRTPHPHSHKRLHASHQRLSIHISALLLLTKPAKRVTSSQPYMLQMAFINTVNS